MKEIFRRWLNLFSYAWLVWYMSVFLGTPIIDYIGGPFILWLVHGMSLHDIYKTVFFMEVLQETVKLSLLIATVAGVAFATPQILFILWAESAEFRRKFVSFVLMPLGALWGGVINYALHKTNLINFDNSWIWFVIIAEIIWLPIWYLLTCKGRGIS